MKEKLILPNPHPRFKLLGAILSLLAILLALLMLFSCRSGRTPAQQEKYKYNKKIETSYPHHRA